MFIVGLFSWWYGTGWRQRAVLLRERLVAVDDYFSIDLLLRTLFNPFRQISAGGVRGPLSVQIQAFFDRLISRCIGAMIRGFIIIIGVISLMVYTVIGGVLLVAWLFVPLLPLVGAVLWLMGWIPWNQ
jgi:hypothetical protein